MPPQPQHRLIRIVFFLACTIAVGVLLLRSDRGEPWRLASYDYLFRFATRPVASQPEVVILFMDSNALAQTSQIRGQAWDRAQHSRLLDRLADDGCPLVVFDVWFAEEREKKTDLVLAQAMKRLSNVVLMAWPSEEIFQPERSLAGIYSIRPLPPTALFLEAAGSSNWGVGSALTNRDGVVRQHWRYPSPGLFDSLAWTAARVHGAPLNNEPEERWVRYYEPGWSWTSLSYVEAEAQRSNYFRNKIVFIGNQPRDDLPNGEHDEFSTPFTRPTGGAVAGVEILATEFLNLIHHEWLLETSAPVEITALIVIGALLGFVLARMRRGAAFVLALVTAVGVMVAGIALTYFTNYWFPWLVIAGGQIPVALACAMAWPFPRTRVEPETQAGRKSDETLLPLPAIDGSINLPDYDLVQPPIGEGAYGKVWLARNAVGQWQALKVIYRAKFGDDRSPYEREFRGIESYKRVSDDHPGLLRVDFVSRMKPQGYFYYAMELADSIVPGWEKNPVSYQPLDLAALCERHQGRLPVPECIRIGAHLCNALHFLHSQGLAHRDIKPRNIVFVHGQPKLADVGLVADVERIGQDLSLVGTPGYMPPEPETPGTPAADIYGLGMVLYVISTGAKPKMYPELSETLVDPNQHPGFELLSPVIFQACQPDRTRRPTAVEMKNALTAITAKASATKPTTEQV